MKNQWQKGASSLGGILVILFILFVMLSGSNSTWTTDTSISSNNYSVGGKGFFRGETLTSSSSNSPTGSQQAPATSGQVSIGTGNASYSYQSYEEYITLDNSGRSPINITGWQLKNGKDQRPYYTGGALQRFSADVAIIPQAALVLSPSGNSFNQDVILGSNERAVITTGSFGNRSPYKVTSFKENICTGYLEELPDYAFTPPLSRNCPDPENEPGIENLDRDCRKIVESLRSCETPQFGERIDQEYCPDCFDGKILPSQCKAFLVEHFSYQGCLIYHQGDKNFSGKTWRIFLGRGWEMWADEYESIELFDRFGQLVNYQNY